MVARDISYRMPDMLTAAQYEAIGRFALAFNEIEFLLEVYIEQFLGTPEWAVASVLAKEGGFSNKLHRFKKVLSAIAAKHPALKVDTDIVSAITNEAQQVADKRNQYVHALVVEDLRTKQANLLIKGNPPAPFNDKEIAALIAKAQGLADQGNRGNRGNRGRSPRFRVF